ncbi:aminotransferase class I/II-fold pyridoxal phosphate-dependent enzyme [Pedobacter sp. SYP-B3415]|uniref:aminotransferase class I/II-fold pyridoxal phosphate-dependent enzyme n=1 Tax=Pedobacter sp. SYP-B3415 TaxID=2496641 RepID=UPI00101E03C6|nr:aminotransferase class I/II-fold pyridoxal phosphate-dependent enzyme [Pedobacter sp. SYP-B3415]
MAIKLQQAISNSIEADGRSYLYFGGTSYLGLATNAEFIDLYKAGMQRYGVNNGTSRSNNIQLALYEEAEAVAADRFGAEAALIVSSGYLAAQLCVRALADHHFIYAPGAHPALWLNDPVPSGQGFTLWLQNLRGQNAKGMVLSNTLNNLQPERYDFSALPGDGSQLLLADDSHGIGLLDNGLGAYSRLKNSTRRETLVVASMAKALGIDAGVVLGTTGRIASLKKHVMFNGASPPAAAALFAFMKSADLYKNQWQKLQENHRYLASALEGRSDWKFISELPVFCSTDPGLQQKLAPHEILISSFPYPDSDGPALNRVVLNSGHTKDQLDELIETINQL